MKWLTHNGYLLMAVTAAVWSGNAIIGRGVHEIVPPIGLAYWRFVATLPLFAILAWPHLRKDLPIALKHWPIMLVLGVLSIAVYNTFIYFGLDHTTAINMVLINTSRPVMIVILSFVFFRLTVTGLQSIGLFLGLVGTGVIVFRGDLDVLLGLKLNIGDLWVLAATVAWAIYTVFFHKKPKIHATSFLTFGVVIGLIFLTPFYIWEAIYVEAVPLVPTTYWSVAYLAVFSSVIAYLGYNRVVELLGANRAGTTSYLIPIFGVALAIPLLGETFHMFHAIGIALLLVGTYLASRAKAT